MIRPGFFHTLSTSILGSLLALGLGACGSAHEPLGEREQPFSAGDADTSAESAACAEGVPQADAADGFCQVTAQGLCFEDAEAACACAGCGSEACVLAESFPAQAFCPSDGASSDPDAPVSSDPDAPVSSDPDAPVSSDPDIGGGTNGNPGGNTSPGFPGTGAGCGTPGHVEPAAPIEPLEPIACASGSTPTTDGTPACDFIVNGACFDDVDAACACAGCSSDACIVQESYPATVSCQ